MQTHNNKSYGKIQKIQTPQLKRQEQASALYTVKASPSHPITQKFKFKGRNTEKAKLTRCHDPETEARNQNVNLKKIGSETQNRSLEAMQARESAYERERESTQVFLQSQKMGFRRNLRKRKEENLSP